MPRFFVPPDFWNPDQLELTGAEAHHCSHVMRLKAGDRVTIFNGFGESALVEIVDVARDRVLTRTVEKIQSVPRSCAITLAQAIPKGKNMELVIEKATELGAASIVPLLTDRTVVQLNAADAAKKQEKWQRIAIEAAKQCGQNWLPRVERPCTMADYFTDCARHDLALIGSLEPDARHLKQVLAERGDEAITSALVCIGPEGDFTPAELALAREKGCAPITFGPIILRTETAAIYCLSVLAHELLGR